MSSIAVNSKLLEFSSYFLLIPLNILIAVIFFLAMKPAGFLPSDDMAFVEIIDKTVACFQSRLDCFPPPAGFYTKPFFLWVCGIFQFMVGKSLNLTSLESMVFVGQIAMALSASILQRQLLCVSSSRVWGLLIGIMLFWTSFTVVGTQLWWGYGQFVGLLVFLGMEVTLRYCVLVEINSTHTPPPLSRQVFYLILLPILGLIACFSSLSAIPFYIAMCAIIYIASFRAEFRTNSISWIALTTRNPLIRAGRWPALVLLTFVTLYFIFAYFSPHGHGYWNVAQSNILVNMKHTTWIVDALGIWFYFTIVFYFIAAEWPTILLLCILSMYLFREYKIHSKNLFLIDERYLIWFHSLFLLICLFGLSISSATKLLRSFYPMHFSFIAIVGILLLCFIRTASATKSKRIFLLTLIAISILVATGFWNSAGNVSCTLAYRRDFPRYIQQSFRESALPRFAEATLFALPESPWVYGMSYFREMVGSSHTDIVNDHAELMSRIHPNDFLVTANQNKMDEDIRWKMWSSLPAETCESLVDVYANENITAHYMARYLPVQFGQSILAAQSRPKLYLYRWAP